MSDFPAFPAAHEFTHDAMNTSFQLRICEADQATASGMARECFEQLDLIEASLSRYRESSDIARINQMQAGETLYISEWCHKCLLIGLDAHSRTAGLFDITLGKHIEHQKMGSSAPLPDLTGHLTILPNIPAVLCKVAGRELDLGGIGKGFALDELQQLLREWGAKGGLLSAGASSQLAFGRAAWPIALAGSNSHSLIALREGALSASGTSIQGSHIIHPAGSSALPAARCERVWVSASNAATAEVWSTALMLLDPKDISEFIRGEVALRSVHIEYQGMIQAILIE